MFPDAVMISRLLLQTCEHPECYAYGATVDLKVKTGDEEAKNGEECADRLAKRRIEEHAKKYICVTASSREVSAFNLRVRRRPHSLALTTCHSLGRVPQYERFNLAGINVFFVE